MKTIQSFTLLALVPALLAGCDGAPEDRPRLGQNAHAIVNGEDAQPGEFPFMVSLKMKAVRMRGDEVLQESYQHLCGGTLISPTQILTAAHCVRAVKNHDQSEDLLSRSFPCGESGERCGVTYPAEGFVFVGEHALGEDEPGVEIRAYTAVDILIHPDFEWKNGKNDLAVITLKEPSRKRPVALAGGEVYEFAEGRDSFLVMGWGRLRDRDEPQEGLNTLPTVMQKAWVPFVGRETCVEHYRRIKPRWVIGESMICAGDYLPTVEKRRDACDGDSGGPLLQSIPHRPGEMLQIGIASWGLGCAKNPGVYTAVGSYLGWAPLQSIAQTAPATPAP